MRALLLILLTFIAGVSIAPAAAQHCEILECRVDCWRVPGGRQCERRCLRRCWRPPPPPVYAPSPHYHPAPRYHAPQQNYADPLQIDPTILAGLGLLAVLFVAFLAGAFNDTSLSREIVAIQWSARSARSQAQEAERKTHAINSYIAEAEADAFQQGRNAADAEWDEFTRHD